MGFSSSFVGMFMTPTWFVHYSLNMHNFCSQAPLGDNIGKQENFVKVEMRKTKADWCDKRDVWDSSSGLGLGKHDKFGNDIEYALNLDLEKTWFNSLNLSFKVFRAEIST